MENQLIMLQNITLAVRAKNILEKSGILGYVQKTPSLGKKAACGYSVYVPENADKAEQILRSRGFVILGRTGKYNL
ncbi:MAG: DUF3343 domain-containing protein [Ruminococcus sp.]|nr:DUF3343 domain-containing protein [Ruminococcus sp.]